MLRILFLIKYGILEPTTMQSSIYLAHVSYIQPVLIDAFEILLQIQYQLSFNNQNTVSYSKILPIFLTSI